MMTKTQIELSDAVRAIEQATGRHVDVAESISGPGFSFGGRGRLCATFAGDVPELIADCASERKLITALKHYNVQQVAA